MECGQPAIAEERICLQKEGDAVVGIDVGALLFFFDGSSGSGLGKT